MIEITQEEIQKTKDLYNKIKVKRSYAGLGLFAIQNIKKGEVVIEYIGNILNDEEVEKKANQYLFEVKKNKTIDGSVRWNTARYINHHCKGNAESEIRKGGVFIVATKNIKKGVEIGYDYGEEFYTEYIIKKYGGCKCDAKKHLYIKNTK